MDKYSNFKDLANHYDYFLFDCDGVLWHGKDTIEGSFEALETLIKLDKKIIYLTNASQRTR
jgi:4-nitrophenyl phosphatase